jgi:hypothetical protein
MKNHQLRLNQSIKFLQIATIMLIYMVIYIFHIFVRNDGETALYACGVRPRLLPTELSTGGSKLLQALPSGLQYADSKIPIEYP